MKKRFANIWDAIESDPVEAENMKIRSRLLTAINQAITAQGWTQAETARRLRVTQPRISDLTRGKIDKFSIDALANMAHAIGLHVDIRIAEPV